MPTLIEFYAGQPITLANGQSITFEAILSSDDEFWEECHHFIQWLFPTRTRSQYSETAPILTEDIAKKIPQERYLRAIQRFGEFISVADMTRFNHNYLRMTRLLESVALILGNAHASSLFACFLYNSRLDLSIESLQYWHLACMEKWNDAD